ncbi:MAG: hypothetical protein ACFFFC_00610 [Candidatus Thorarchaeota archaeon]
MRIIKQSPYCFNELEINRDWLPTYIVKHEQLLDELHRALVNHFQIHEGKWLYDKSGNYLNIDIVNHNLDEMHEFAVNWLCARIITPGVADNLLIRDYLNAISQVKEPQRKLNFKKEINQ